MPQLMRAWARLCPIACHSSTRWAARVRRARALLQYATDGKVSEQILNYRRLVAITSLATCASSMCFLFMVWNICMALRFLWNMWYVSLLNWNHSSTLILTTKIELSFEEKPRVPRISKNIFWFLLYIKFVYIIFYIRTPFIKILNTLYDGNINILSLKFSA